MTDKTRVILEPIMLNPGDYVDFRILVSNSAGVDSEGRIAGVKDIHPAPYTIFGLGALGRQKASPHMTFRK
jgi:hypothetical protein